MKLIPGRAGAWALGAALMSSFALSPARSEVDHGASIHAEAGLGWLAASALCAVGDPTIGEDLIVNLCLCVWLDAA